MIDLSFCLLIFRTRQFAVFSNFFEDSILGFEAVAVGYDSWCRTTMAELLLAEVGTDMGRFPVPFSQWTRLYLGRL